MAKVYNLGPKGIYAPDTPELMWNFYEWGQRTNAVADHSFYQYSDYLTLCNMNVKSDRPPNFFLVGSRSATRAKLGDQWAEQMIRTQVTPVKRLDEITAGGYLNALKYGYNYDILSICDDCIRTTYRRLILPIRSSHYMQPNFFAMLLFFDEFSQLSHRQDSEDHRPVRKISKNLH